MNVVVGGSKRLSTRSEHIGDLVHVIATIEVNSVPTDVANFQDHTVRQLALKAQGPSVFDSRLALGIDSKVIGLRGGIAARKQINPSTLGRWHYRGCNRLQWRDGHVATIDADAEPGIWVNLPSPAGIGPGRPSAGYPITETHAQCWCHNNAHTVDTVEVTAKSGSDYGLPVTEEGIEQTAPTSRVPGNGQTRSEVVPIHIVGIFAARLAHRHKAEQR